MSVVVGKGASRDNSAYFVGLPVAADRSKSAIQVALNTISELSWVPLTNEGVRVSNSELEVPRMRLKEALKVLVKFGLVKQARFSDYDSAFKEALLVLAEGRENFGEMIQLKNNLSALQDSISEYISDELKLEINIPRTSSLALLPAVERALETIEYAGKTISLWFTSEEIEGLVQSLQTLKSLINDEVTQDRSSEEIKTYCKSEAVVSWVKSIDKYLSHVAKGPSNVSDSNNANFVTKERPVEDPIHSLDQMPGRTSGL